MRIAVTRKVSARIGQCELTHLPRTPIDFARAQEQHEAYEKCLAALGCEVHSLPAAPELPDSVFVEDAAVVFDELAIITRPGAESRRPETAAIAEAVKPYRELHFLRAPATVDGGDVLRVGKQVFVGLSQRTNQSGLEQVRAILSPHGYTVAGVPVRGCLHLKSAVTQVAENTLLINANWMDPRALREMEWIEVAPSEPSAANALWIGESVLYPSACAETRRRLEDRGLSVVALDVSEFAKAEGGVTCCSLVFESRAAARVDNVPAGA